MVARSCNSGTKMPEKESGQLMRGRASYKVGDIMLMGISSAVIGGRSGKLGPHLNRQFHVMQILKNNRE